MYDQKKNIEEILSRNNLGIYNLMKFHFGIGNQITKKFPYADLTRIFSEKKQIDQKIFLKIGSSLELLNASFEVHEDVRNGNTERNKTESLWWKYGPAQAINVGDGFQAISRSVLLELSNFTDDYSSVIKIISKLDESIIEICEAENHELKLQESPTATINDFTDSISNKFGALISNCFLLPSYFLEKKDQENLRNLGNSLAIFEKIRREVDFFESTNNEDSPEIGSFISKNKPLTVIFALEDGTPTLKREIGEIYIQRVIDPKNIQKIKDLCLETGSLLKTKELAKTHQRISEETLNDLGLEDSKKEEVFKAIQSI